MLLLELALRCRSSMWLIYRNALLYIRSVLMTRNGWFIASSILSEISSTVILPLGMPMDRWNNTNFHPTLSNFRLRRRTFPALFCYRSSTPMGLSHCAFSQEKELSYLRMNVLTVCMLGTLTHFAVFTRLVLLQLNLLEPLLLWTREEIFHHPV